MPTHADIAAAIKGHLQRFEADPDVNKGKPGQVPPVAAGAARFQGVSATPKGVDQVRIVYHDVTNAADLTQDEAQAYLDWLDAENVGTHFDKAARCPKTRLVR